MIGRFAVFTQRYFNRPAIRRGLHRSSFWAVFLLIVIAGLLGGLVLRRYAWDQSEPFRYTTDIDNAFRQGTKTLQIGYIDRYDERETEHDTGWSSDLDYAPGRLAVATLWSQWVHRQVDPPSKNPDKITNWRREFYPTARSLNRQYELCRPMLMINITGEILSAVAMFLLVRRYTAGQRPVRGIILGLIAALFFWFNPALIWNAHCWPQWDSWVLPFFLWAVLLASLNWWFCAGALIATGAMFKGQILFGAPMFLLWPLWQGRLPAMARWIVGLLTATAAITAVWLVRVPGVNPTGGHFITGHVNPASIEWVIYLTALFAVMPPLLWNWRNPWARLPGALLLVAIVGGMTFSTSSRISSTLFLIALITIAVTINFRWPTWTWHIKLPVVWFAIFLLICPIWLLAHEWMFAVLSAVVGLAILLRYAPRRVLPFAGAGWISAALLLCIPLFGGSKGWFDLGIALGTHHYARMTSSENNNLAELLQERWGWDDLIAPAVTLPPGPAADHVNNFLIAVDPGVEITQQGKPVGLPLKYLLLCVWIAAVVLCSIGTAIHDRRRSPQFLAAMAAPWIVFFAVMTQMHQRYLLWGASLSAASAVLSPGYAALHLFLSAVAMGQEMTAMFHNSRSPLADNAINTFISNWHPGISWAVLLCAVIFVYTAVKPHSRRQGEL